MQQIILQIKNIKKSYQNKKALKDINLDIYEGEIFTLLGVNGAGKTTLSSIIATLHPATSGDIFYKNKSIYEDIYSYRQELGFCPQKPNLDQFLSLRENLIFAGRFFGLEEDLILKRIDFLAKQFNLIEYLDQTAAVLSGGYKQRFMIARSLIHNPKILLLDEPTVGLDPHIRRQLWSTIRDLKNHGITIILTTHYLDEAEKLSDRVCILDNGVIKLVETPNNLKKEFKDENLENIFIALTNQE